MVVFALILMLGLVALAWWAIISGWHGAQDDGASTWEMVKITLGASTILGAPNARRDR